MTEDEVRRKIEGRFRGDLVSDAIWNAVRHDGFVRDYHWAPEGSEDRSQAWGYLVQAVGRHLGIVRDTRREAEARKAGTYVSERTGAASEADALPESEPPATGDPGPALDHYQKLMEYTHHVRERTLPLLWAMSVYMECEANAHPEIQAFRKRFLGERLLTKERATRLLQSHAARFLTLEQLEAYSIPLEGHDATIETPYEEIPCGEYVDHRVTIGVKPPDVTLKLRYTDRPERQSPSDTETLCRRAENGRTAEPYQVPLPSSPSLEAEQQDAGERQPGKRYVGAISLQANTGNRPYEVWPGSFVDEVYEFAKAVARAYFWPSYATDAKEMSAVALFLLTGMAPLQRPVRVRLLGGDSTSDALTRVQIEALPWVSAEDVGEAYSVAQRHLGGPHKLSGSRTFRVVSFVLTRRGKGDRGHSTWGRLCEEWNKNCTGEDRFPTPENFRTYYQRGLKAVEKRLYLQAEGSSS